jgi:2-polyprenyl-6-methoxyphenol hydroxylase-like FAD-dependent oxidoreductase
MRETGLLDQALTMRTHRKGMSMLDIDGKEIARTEERTISAGRLNGGDIEILGDDLAGLLLSAGQPHATYLFDDTITALEQDDASVAVAFERTPPRRFDGVIGADGVHSNTRQIVFGDEASLTRPLGVALSIFTTPNLLELRDWQLAFRDATSLRFGIWPEDDVRGDVAAQKSVLGRQALCASAGDIPRLIEAMLEAKDFYFGALARVRMESWSKGCVTLAGDAAYCPSPFTGQGTSLALVGAFVLAKELVRSPEDHAGAFARCEARMRNQDMVSLERREPIPDDIFDQAKNAITIDDLIPI